MKKITLKEETLAAYEDILVQEFRTLQSLIGLINKARQMIARRDHPASMQAVEQIETVLDQFNLMEDARRNLFREISLDSGYATQTNSLAELLPLLDPQAAARLERLNQGLSILAGQAKGLNQGNNVLAADVYAKLGITRAGLLRVGKTGAPLDLPATPEPVEDADQGLAQGIRLQAVMGEIPADAPGSAAGSAVEAGLTSQAEITRDELSALILLDPEISVADAVFFLQQRQNVYQAALEVGERAISSMSLFDYTH